MSRASRLIYLDHAATSWPKPPEVVRAMADFMARAGGNPGRSGHRLSIAAARFIFAAREAVAELFHVENPLRVIFTHNATHALNVALRGCLKPGDHVVTSSIEHNSVMRPLRALQLEGVRVTVVHCKPDGYLEPAAVAGALTPSTRLVVLAHASNVCGVLQPVAEVARHAHRFGAWVLLDAAQTAGVVPMDVARLGADLVAFSGHKGLQGPMGTGGLILGDRVDPTQLEPLVRGGTGSQSESEEQPQDLPDKYESGTPNGVGLAGLDAGVRWVLRHGVNAIREKEMENARMLLEGLSAIPGVAVHGPQDRRRSVAVVSFSVRGFHVSEIGTRLDEEHSVLCRVGLHCAPAAHRTLGTFPEGTVRLAPGPFTTRKDIQKALAAVSKVVRG
jgi:cysteine desulfurase/selenocysteine lyase